MSPVRGCHLVGSVPLETTPAVFERLRSLRQYIKRYPDGEIGERRQFVGFQKCLFPEFIHAELDFSAPKPPQSKLFTDQEEIKGLSLLRKVTNQGINTGYDDAAIRSYGLFKKWKNSGNIPPGAKFQVSMPTLGNVVGSFISPPFQKEAEKLYQDALFKALHNIQMSIPHGELAIQLDMGVDMLYWVDGWNEPWWKEAGKDYLTDYIARMANKVEPGVELGLHFCYGDIAHQHTVEPDTLSGITEFAQEIFKKLKRPAAYMHCPVPLSALGRLEYYFQPIQTLLPQLRHGRTELFLGLVHANNADATNDMISAACKALDGFEFGVSTECGWGRTPDNHLDSIINITRSVSKPYRELTL